MAADSYLVECERIVDDHARVGSDVEHGAFLNLDPSRSRAILDSVGREIQKLENLGKSPIIITSPIVRMYFKRLTEDYYRDLVVVSYNEVESNVELQSVGMVTA